jgi:hypothetical protein
MAQDPDKPEQPRVEPEIIPPDRGERQGWPPPYGYSRTYGTQRLYVTRIGPFGFALLMLVVGLLSAVFLLALIGTALIWIPLVAALVLIAFISRLFRR